MKFRNWILLVLLGLLLARWWGCFGESEALQEEQPNAEQSVQKKRKEAAPNLQPFLVAYAKQIESQKILYGSERLSDCSGIFLRTMQALAQEYTAYRFPKASSTRSSRALAKWFNKHGDLEIVDDALVIGDQIRPGSVLFYGKSGRSYKNPTLSALTNPSTGIEHVGIVTAVTRNEQGMVTQYRLFHGRSRGKMAGRTDFHYRNPKRDLPPYGNWNQQLVAIAYCLSAKK